MEASRLTTLQRELLRFVAIIAGMATAVAILMVILWAAWLVTFLVFVIPFSPIHFFRLRKDHPNYINVPGLLIDVVSVMGLSFSLQSSCSDLRFISRLHSRGFTCGGDLVPGQGRTHTEQEEHSLQVCTFSARHKLISNKASGPCPSSRPLVLSTSCVQCVYLTSLHFNKLMRHSQDKTGTLTQNIMHVENLAIFDSVYESNAFRTVITNSDPPVENNLSQIAAVGAICNAATFDVGAASGSDEKKIQGKGIVGNATGQSDYFFNLDLLYMSHQTSHL